METMRLLAMTGILVLMVVGSVMIADNTERVREITDIQKKYTEMNEARNEELLKELARLKEIVNRLKLKADLEELELKSGYSFDFEKE
jgi:hypothetical protein